MGCKTTLERGYDLGLCQVLWGRSKGAGLCSRLVTTRIRGKVCDYLKAFYLERGQNRERGSNCDWGKNSFRSKGPGQVAVVTSSAAGTPLRFCLCSVVITEGP